jgi:ParB family chromosome partitioning protein
MWSMHDRMEETVTDETCRREIESFLRHGQLVPVLGRPTRGDPDYDVELIYGARRLFVARQLKKPLAVKLQALSDRDALIAMDIENRQRVDISALERGRSYTRWLRAGYFASQDELARTLRISSAQLSRLLKIARLPSVIIGAFATPADILERWGLELSDAWGDPLRRAGLAAAARQLGAQSPRLEPRVIYQRLIAADRARSRRSAPSRDLVVTSRDGKALFRVKHQHKAVVLWLPHTTTLPHVLQEITRHVADVLQRESSQAFDSTGRRKQIATDAAERIGLLRKGHAPAGELIDLLHVRQRRDRVDSLERIGGE